LRWIHLHSMNGKEERVGGTPDRDRERERATHPALRDPMARAHGEFAYLFAAFNFKTEVSEGLAEEQLEAVKGWNAALA
jgi:hypothetical protein